MTNKDNPTPLPLDEFQKCVECHGEKIYLRQPVNRKFRETSWRQAYDQTLRLAAGLRSLGLEPGDRVAILAENCAEWFISDFAIQAAGLISVPIYFTAGEDIIRYILEHSESKALLVGKLGSTKAVEAAVSPNLITIYMPYDTMPCKVEMATLIADNEPISEIAKPSLDDTFSITYTSGSTGNPKGVVLTFRNIAYGGNSMASMMDIKDKDVRLLSYLPLAHITERALIEYFSLYAGATVSFSESLETFIDDLKDARVTFFLSVPRLWMKFQAGVLAKTSQQKLDRLLKIPIVKGIVKRKIRNQLGFKDADSLGSGSAPISPAVLKWYENLGMNISEGWGMTELTGLATSQFPYRFDKMGTIGKCIDGLEITTSDEGEILVRGDGVFKEYYKNDAVTAETFTEDGFMRTGDKADIDEDGYLRITGRVKDLFKSGKGKYIAPVPIEAKLAVNQYIEQACVMGSGLPAAMVVVVLERTLTEGLSRDEIAQSLAETVQEVNKQIEKHEVLGGVRIASEPWTVENGLLTPTLKIKRAELEQKYKNLISEKSDQVVVWE